MGAGASSDSTSGSESSAKRKAKYMDKRPERIETKSVSGENAKETPSRLEIVSIPGGDSETACIYARAQEMIKEGWIAEVAEKCNIQQHKDSPKKRSSATRIARSPSEASPTIARLRSSQSYASAFSPISGSTLISPGDNKVLLIESLTLSAPFVLIATPSALVIHWKSFGRGPSDFQSVDEYNVQWIVDPDDHDETFLKTGDTKFLKLKGSRDRGGVKELFAWSAPGSIRNGVAPLHFQASNADWNDVPSKVIRHYDKMLIVQGLDSQCVPLRFRVRACKNSIWGAFSGISEAIRTTESIRIYAPRTPKVPVSPFGMEITWQPLKHFDPDVDVTYFLFAKAMDESASFSSAKSKALSTSDDPFKTMDQLHMTKQCRFIAGGEGEEPLQSNTRYALRLSACWIDVDGSKNYVHSGIAEIRTAITPPPSQPRPPSLSESIVESQTGVPSIQLQLRWEAPPGEGYAYASGSGLTFYVFGTVPPEDASRQSVLASDPTLRICAQSRYALYYSGREKKLVLGGEDIIEMPGMTALGTCPVVPGSHFSFMVCASNEFGKSDYSKQASITASLEVLETMADAQEDGDGHSSRKRSEFVYALSKEWSEVWTKGSRDEALPYYYNTQTMETQWEFPVDDASAKEELKFRKKRFQFLFALWKLSDAVESDDVPLKLKLRRTHVLYDSFRCFKRFTSSELVNGKLNISYFGEDGIDSGGITKDWFIDMSKQFANPEACLLRPVEEQDGSVALWFDKKSSVQPDHLEYYCMMGRFLGKAILDRHVVSLPLHSVIFKHILGIEPTLEDLKAFDKVKYNSLCWMLENDVTDVFEESFTVLVDQFGTKKEVELIPGGAKVNVTEENKSKYVRAVVKWELDGGKPLKSLLDGVFEIVPPYLLRETFTAKEFDTLLNGRSDIQVEKLKSFTWYDGGYEAATRAARRKKGKKATTSSSHPTIKLFWEAMERFDETTKARLLQFATGSSKLPLDGFHPPFTIVKSEHDGALPTAHTCFNQLVLPAYASLDDLEEKIKFALDNVSGFHMS